MKQSEKPDFFQKIRLKENLRFLDLIDALDVNQINEFGQNLLHEAIGSGNEIAALQLLEKGINANHQDSTGLTPLHYAISHDNLTLGKALLAKGARVDIADLHGNQPLWTAVLNAGTGYGFVESLVEFGADPKHKNKYGKSPLSIAEEMGVSELLSSLR